MAGRTPVASTTAENTTPVRCISPSSGGSSSPVDCTTFIGLNPKLLIVKAALGQVDVEVSAGAEQWPPAEFLEGLYQLLEHTPVGWNWRLDLAALPVCDIRTLDVVVAVGKHLRVRGGRLAVQGLQPASFPAPFGELFLTQCREHRIQVQISDAGSTARKEEVI